MNPNFAPHVLLLEGLGVRPAPADRHASESRRDVLPPEVEATRAPQALPGDVLPSQAAAWRTPMRRSTDWRYPASRYSRLGFLTIFATFGVFGAWAGTAPLSGAVMVRGTVVVEGSRKLIQHLEGGIVRRVLVEDGTRVEKGQLLVELSPTDSLASRNTVAEQRLQLTILQSRLSAERDGRTSIDFAASGLDLNDPQTKALVRTQELAFNDRRENLESEIRIMQSRIAQLHEVASGLQIQRDALAEQGASLAEQLSRLRSGEQVGVVTRNNVAVVERQAAEMKGAFGNAQAELGRTGQAMAEIELEIMKARQSFKERANSELRETQDQLRLVTQKLTVADDVLNRTEIRAPIAGVVQNLKVHTEGGVVRPAESIMELVPTDTALFISGHVRSTDIDSVHPGAQVEIKFPSLSSRTVPLLSGEILSVSADTITPQADGQEPYYAAKIEIDRNSIPAPMLAKVVAGMPAETVVPTAQRTLLEYVLSPLQDVVAHSLREE